MSDDMRETMSDLQRFGLPDRDLKGVLDAVEDLNYLLNHGYGLGSLEKEIGELIAEAEKLREKGREELRDLASKRNSDGGYTGEGELPELAKPLRPGECLTPAAHGSAALTAFTLIGLLQAVPQDALIAYESDSDSAFIGRIGVSEDGVVLLHPGADR